MFSVYFLESLENGSYYTGYTESAARRLLEHNETPHKTFTSRHRPWKIIAEFGVVKDISIAMQAGNS